MDREEEGGYVAHGVCAMLVPRQRKGYDLYYMNPHGEVMKPYTYYEIIKTRTRCQKLDFDKEIIDVVVMRSIVDYCNKHFDHDIHYDGSLRHNYLGVNLQEEDVHGVCYIFPHLVYYYFGKYFTEKRELEAEGIKRSLPSFKEMLDSGDFNLAIHSCFVEFDTNYKKAIIDSDLIRREALQQKVCYTTTLTGAKALIEALRCGPLDTVRRLSLIQSEYVN